MTKKKTGVVVKKAQPGSNTPAAAKGPAKVAPVKAPAKTPAPAPAPAAPVVLAKKPTARDIEYTPEATEAIGAKLDELVNTLPVVIGRDKSKKNTARKVIMTYWPKIKELINKGYAKSFIRDELAKAGLMDVPIATFLNVCKALEKLDKANAEKAELEMHMPAAERTIEFPKGEISEADRQDTERLIEEHSTSGDNMLQEPDEIVKI
jgi:hypothetical protein